MVPCLSLEGGELCAMVNDEESDIMNEDESSYYGVEFGSNPAIKTSLCVRLALVYHG